MQSKPFEAAPKNAPSNSDKVFYTRPAQSDNIFSAWRAFFCVCRLSPGRAMRRAPAISPLAQYAFGLRLFRPLQGSIRLRGLRLFRLWLNTPSDSGYFAFGSIRLRTPAISPLAQYAFGLRLFRPLQGSIRLRGAAMRNSAYAAPEKRGRHDFRISCAEREKKTKKSPDISGLCG